MGHSETTDIISYISETRRWHPGGRELNYLLKLPSCFSITAVV
jgi:hypothetical protein